MVKKYPYVKELIKISDGSTNVDVDDDPVPPGRKIVIKHWAAIDETSAFTELTLLRKIGKREHELEEQKSPAANTLYWSTNEYHFTEGEVISTRFTGTTSGDVLKVYLDGYWIKVEEE